MLLDVPRVNRSNRRGPNSSSRNSRHGLEPVAEEYPDPNFKLSSLTENGMIPDQGTMASETSFLL